jgi:hypothetical protein
MSDHQPANPPTIADLIRRMAVQGGRLANEFTRADGSSASVSDLIERANWRAAGDVQVTVKFPNSDELTPNDRIGITIIGNAEEVQLPGGGLDFRADQASYAAIAGDGVAIVPNVAIPPNAGRVVLEVYRDTPQGMERYVATRPISAQEHGIRGLILDGHTDRVEARVTETTAGERERSEIREEGRNESTDESRRRIRGVSAEGGASQTEAREWSSEDENTESQGVRVRAEGGGEQRTEGRVGTDNLGISGQGHIRAEVEGEGSLAQSARQQRRDSERGEREVNARGAVSDERGRERVERAGSNTTTRQSEASSSAWTNVVERNVPSRQLNLDVRSAYVARVPERATSGGREPVRDTERTPSRP